ncbi:LptF/LptG family permease [Candidatus Riflebacteria bacterium]
MSRLDRFILKTIIPPFIYGVLIFVSIFVVDIFMQLLDLAARRNLSHLVVMQLFLLKLPEIVVLTLPMGSLFAVILGFGQLDSQSEITALKAGGISLYRQVAPVAFFAIFIASASFFINESLVPRCNKRFTKIFKLEVSLKNPIPKISKGEIFEIGNHQKFYVKKYNHKENIMYGVTMVTPQKRKNFPRTIVADRAQFKDGYCYFWDGRISIVDKNGREYRYILYKNLKYPIDTYKIDPVHIKKDRASKPNQMNYYDLKKYISELKKKGVERRYLIDYRVELYNKISVPMASIIFILIGIPLSMGEKRSQKSGGAGLSIIIIFAYYILMSLGKAFSRSRFISPVFGAFLPNLIFFIFGLFLIYRKRF